MKVCHMRSKNSEHFLMLESFIDGYRDKRGTLHLFVRSQREQGYQLRRARDTCHTCAKKACWIMKDIGI